MSAAAGTHAQAANRAPAQVPFFDPRRLLAPHDAALQAAFARVLQHAVFVLGPEVAAFEQALASSLGARRAVGVSSGSDALLATFMALRLPTGAEILCTPFTFIASASSIVRAGLRPVFVDLSAEGFLPTAEAFERAWGNRTAGILAVHLYGEPADCDPLAALCKARGGVLIEDCAQAIGARDAQGRSVGLSGRAGTLSFFPAKNLGALGDGGAVFGDDLDLLAAVERLRQHGRAGRDVFSALGGNFRLDALQAALLQVLLPVLPSWIAARQRNAATYLEALRPLHDAERLILPTATPGHAWNQFTLRTPRRDALAQALTAAGIGSAVYYTVPLHRCPALADAMPQAALPHAERAAAEVLSLPVYPGLRADEQARVIEVVQAALAC